MSEFEAYDNLKKCWDVFPLSKLNKMRKNPRYSNFIVDKNNI